MGRGAEVGGREGWDLVSFSPGRVWKAETRIFMLAIWWAGIREKQAETVSGISPENVFFLLLVALNLLFYLYLVIDKS